MNTIENENEIDGKKWQRIQLKMDKGRVNRREKDEKGKKE